MLTKKTPPRSHSWFKIVTLTLCSILGITIIGTTMLVLLVNPNNYKPLLMAQAQQQLGAQLQLGSLRWELFPRIGIKITGVTLDSATPLNSTPLLQLEEGEISLQILPLLHGKFNVDQIILKNAQLNLFQNQSQNNWTFNHNPSSANTNNTPTTTNYAVQLSEIKLENINLHYQNLATNHATSLNNLNLSLQANDSGLINYSTADGNLILNKVNYVINRQLQGVLNLNYANGNYNGDLKAAKFSLPKLLDSLNLSTAGLNAEPWQNFAFAGQFSGTSNSLQLKNSVINLGDSTIQLTLNADSLTPLHANNQVQIDRIEASNFVSLKGYHLRLINATLEGNITNNPRTNQLRIDEKFHSENLTLYGYDLHNLSLQIGSILSNPLKIIAIPVTVTQLRSSVVAAGSNEHKNLNLASNLGSLNAYLSYSAPQLQISQLNINGPDVRASGNGMFNSTSNYLNARINAQFVADPNSLTGKIVYPVSINGNQTTIDWTSVSTQLSKNLGSSLINTGKQVGSTTGSVAKSIGNKIKSWF